MGKEPDDPGDWLRFDLPPGWADPKAVLQPAPISKPSDLSDIGNVKQMETSMFNIATSETVKQRPAMAYIGVRIPQALLNKIDAMGGSRSETIRELLQFALNVKQQVK